MTTFYCDRLEDEISTKENIAGLSTLQQLPGFGEEEVTKVCNAYVRTNFWFDGRLFNDVDTSKHLQATRLSIYTLFDSMMKKQRKSISSQNCIN